MANPVEKIAKDSLLAKFLTYAVAQATAPMAKYDFFVALPIGVSLRPEDVADLLMQLNNCFLDFESIDNPVNYNCISLNLEAGQKVYLGIDEGVSSPTFSEDISAVLSVLMRISGHSVEDIESVMSISKS